jgi:preprotein translocase subunit SecG
MLTVVTILLLIIAILLIAVVLIQPGKGDMITGLGTIGGSMSSMFGTRRAADMLSKMTIGLAIAMLVIVLLTNMFLVGTNSSGESKKAITEGVAIPMQTVPAPIKTTPQQPQQPNQNNK